MHTENSSYKELVVWQKSMAYVNVVLQLVDDLDTPRKHYRLFEQLESAATSIPMNIAEGKGIDSKNRVYAFSFYRSWFTF